MSVNPATARDALITILSGITIPDFTFPPIVKAFQGRDVGTRTACFVFEATIQRSYAGPHRIRTGQTVLLPVQIQVKRNDFPDGVDPDQFLVTMDNAVTAAIEAANSGPVNGYTMVPEESSLGYHDEQKLGGLFLNIVVR